MSYRRLNIFIFKIINLSHQYRNTEFIFLY